MRHRENDRGVPTNLRLSSTDFIKLFLLISEFEATEMVSTVIGADSLNQIH
jgi:hypothetical protein